MTSLPAFAILLVWDWWLRFPPPTGSSATDVKLQELVAYFELWSHYGINGPRTTNAADGWHSSLKTHFGIPNPSLRVFLYWMAKCQLEVFSAREQDCAEKYKLAVAAVNAGNFVGVCLMQVSAKTAKEINKQQFYQALVNVMSVRLMPDSDNVLVQCVQTLLANTWSSAVCAEYGETQLKEACHLFLVPHTSQLKNEYRDFKDSRRKEIGLSLRCLLRSIQSLPMSTAECERGFSRMNLICTHLDHSTE